MARCKVCFALLLLLCTLPVQALQSYAATYKISARGISAGTVHHSARFTPHSYTLSTRADPSLVARMLGFGVITESVDGALSRGRVEPRHYQRMMDGDASFRLVYDYRPKQYEIKAQIGNNQKVLKYDTNTHPLDVLSLIVQTLIDEEQHRIAKQYSLLNDDKIRTYSVEKMPDEVWKTRDGHYINVRVFRQSSGERQTKIYFADQPLRLMQLTQIKGGQTRFNLKLINYQMLP